MSPESLEQHGDQLERTIVKIKDLLPVINPYARIWEKHILPRRNSEEPEFVRSEWMKFAARHYTALVRTYHVYKCWERINSVVLKLPASSLKGEEFLELHEATASFWLYSGSAIDNLKGVKGLVGKLGTVDAETDEDKHNPIRCDLPSLVVPYERRTQVIHSALIPLGEFDDDQIVFNEALLTDENTDWEVSKINIVEVRDYYQNAWTDLITNLSKEWWTIVKEISARDKGPFEFGDDKRPIWEKKQFASFTRQTAASSADKIASAFPKQLPNWSGFRFDV